MTQRTLAPVVMTCLWLSGCGDSGAVALSLRGAEADTRFVAPTGPGGRQFVSRGPNGWAIAVPNGLPAEAVGLTAKAVIRGDFRLEATYHIDVLEDPKSGTGSGPSLYVASDEGAKHAAQLARLDRPKEGSVVSTAFLYSDRNDKRRHELQFVPSEATSGRLRLERQGSLMIYSTSELDQEWTELRRVEFGQQPVSIVRLALERGGSPTPAKMHWTEISLVLNELPLSWNPNWYRRSLFLAGTMVFPICLIALWMMIDFARGSMDRKPSG